MGNEINEPEFWETNFNEKQEMWGLEPAKSAVITGDLFVAKGVKHILIPGIGYGRNARVFRDCGIEVTGIEISQTAIDLARKHYGNDLKIYHGSVTDMPFDNERYDGIFCYAVIHLLHENERKKLIRDCYDQLAPNGYMVFTVITKEAPTYRKGDLIGKDRYEMFGGGVKMFFYDRASVQEEFGAAGLVGIEEIEENYPFFLITCRKDGILNKK
jgi:SAM-dependent methyltransferase